MTTLPPPSSQPQIPVGVNTTLAGGFARTSFDLLHNQVESAISWMDTLGVRLDNTRLMTYRRDIKELAENYRDVEAVNKMMHRFEQILNSAFEAMDLIAIHTGLHAHPQQDAIRDRLEMMACGPEFGSMEKPASSSNRARNYAFELITAGRFTKAGYTVDLSDTADIILLEGQDRTYIECKRPQVQHKVHSNVKDAIKQLRGQLGEEREQSNSRSLVALSIDKTVPTAHRVLRAANDKAAGSELEKMVNQFRIDHEASWNGFKDSRFMGVLLTYRTIAILNRENIISVACQDHLIDRSQSQADSTRLFAMAAAYNGTAYV